MIPDNSPPSTFWPKTAWATTHFLLQQHHSQQNCFNQHSDVCHFKFFIPSQATCKNTVIGIFLLLSYLFQFYSNDFLTGLECLPECQTTEPWTVLSTHYCPVFSLWSASPIESISSSSLTFLVDIHMFFFFFNLLLKLKLLHYPMGIPW